MKGNDKTDNRVGIIVFDQDVTLTSTAILKEGMPIIVLPKISLIIEKGVNIWGHIALKAQTLTNFSDWEMSLFISDYGEFELFPLGDI